MPSSRSWWLWVSVGAAWIPILALYGALVAVAHPGTSTTAATLVALRIVGPGALLGLAVRRFVRRHPWPGRPSLAFLGLHIVAAAAYSATLYLVADTLELMIRGSHAMPPTGRVSSLLLFGLWLYIMVASLSYAVDSGERAGRAESIAVRTRLASLQAQLQPHFLFNALHSVVHLIPVDPLKAANAAERVGMLLRVAIEEERNLIPFTDELSFVEGYLALEQLRFGDRLVIVTDIEATVREVSVPAFALQTLVENAVRHGAAPRVDPTTVRISARLAADAVVLSVADDGAGADPHMLGSGTGLQRLQERLSTMYGGSGHLSIVTMLGAGFEATLTLPYDDFDAP